MKPATEVCTRHAWASGGQCGPFLLVSLHRSKKNVGLFTMGHFFQTLDKSRQSQAENVDISDVVLERKFQSWPVRTASLNLCGGGSRGLPSKLQSSTMSNLFFLPEIQSADKRSACDTATSHNNPLRYLVSGDALHRAPCWRHHLQLQRQRRVIPN